MNTNRKTGWGAIKRPVGELGRFTDKAVTGARKAERVIILSRNTEANAWFAKFPGEGAPIETAFTLSKPYVEVQAEIARRNPGFSVISDGLNTKQSSKTDSGKAPSEQGMLSRTIQTNNRSGTFSAKADYVPTSDGKVRVYDWVFDALGIVPSGTEMRLVSLEIAQSEFRERMANGWTF